MLISIQQQRKRPELYAMAQLMGKAIGRRKRWLPIREIIDECEKHFELGATFRSQTSVHLHGHGIHHLPQPPNPSGTPFLQFPHHIRHFLPLPPAPHSPPHHHRRQRARRHRHRHRHPQNPSPHLPRSTNLHPYPTLPRFLTTKTKRRRFNMHKIKNKKTLANRRSPVRLHSGEAKWVAGDWDVPEKCEERERRERGTAAGYAVVLELGCAGMRGGPIWKDL